MAVLTDDEKVKIRRGLEKWANDQGVPIAWVKAAVNDAAQAVEDALQSMKISVSADMDTASQAHGVTFSNPQKKIIAAWVMELNHVRDTI